VKVFTKAPATKVTAGGKRMYFRGPSLYLTCYLYGCIEAGLEMDALRLGFELTNRNGEYIAISVVLPWASQLRATCRLRMATVGLLALRRFPRSQRGCKVDS
jgi:hypothetical protein